MAVTVFLRNSEELLEAFDAATSIKPLVICGNEADTLCKALKERNKPNNKIGLQIQDRDISFREGHIFSHADQKHYPNRQAWDDHLKRNNCFEVGNEKPKQGRKAGEVRGDFNCRKELTEATKQVLQRSH